MCFNIDSFSVYYECIFNIDSFSVYYECIFNMNTFSKVLLIRKLTATGQFVCIVNSFLFLSSLSCNR